MKRSIPSGTPSRPTGYQLPRKRRLIALLAAPSVCIVALSSLYLARFVGVASPGPLAARHTPLETRCEACHRSTIPRRVVDMRCERCHDPRLTDRFSTRGHAAIGTAIHQARADVAFGCADCHADHRGRDASLRHVDNHECSTCHRFSTLSGHPEFRLVGTTRAPGRGLVFDHARHLNEVQRVLGRRCEACHRPTEDLTGFEAISFDDHCARCHVVGGVLPGISDPVAESLLQPFSPSSASSGALSTLMLRRTGRGTIVVGGMKHRDDWTLRNLRRLLQGVDAALPLERVELQARVDSLRRALAAGLLADRSFPELENRAGTLRETLSGLDRRLNAPPDEGALGGQVEAAQTWLATLGSPPSTDRLTAVPNGQDATTTPPGDRFRQFRGEVLRLLLRLEQTGSDPIRARAAPLVDESLATEAGASGKAAAEEQHRQLQRLLERVNLELELRATGQPPAISFAARLGDQRAFETAIAMAESLSNSVDSAPPTPLTGDERQQRLEAAQALLVPCLTCHESTGNGGLSPVPRRAPILSHARFTHAPHVVQFACDTCHLTVASSRRASDVNTPGLDTCRSCHGNGPAPSNCTDCHQYHPSAGALLDVPRRRSQ